MSEPRAVYWRHDACLEHDPRALIPGHPDTPERLRAIEARLTAAGWPGWQLRPAPAADERQLELVHDARLVDAIRAVCAAGGGAIDPDTAVGPASYRAALHAAGGACAMANALLGGEARVGFCGARPSGHHAESARAMGFCLFNNVAIAAELAIRELGARRVFILDWDVHHGNGTAEIFARRADVLFASIHQAGIYPGSGALREAGSGAGEGYTINLPVPAGSREELWLSLLEHVVLPAARAFAPELVLVSAGFDAHEADPLAGCCLHTDSFAQLAWRTRSFAHELGVPLGAALEGGYEPAALAQCVEVTLAALAGEEPRGAGTPDASLSAAAAAQVGRYWPL